MKPRPIRWLSSILAGTVLACAAPAFSHADPDPGGTAATAGDIDSRLAELTQLLSLSEGQQGRVSAILHQESKEINAALGEANSKDGYDKAGRIRKKAREQIEAGLSKGQRDDFSHSPGKHWLP